MGYRLNQLWYHLWRLLRGAMSVLVILVFFMVPSSPVYATENTWGGQKADLSAARKVMIAKRNKRALFDAIRIDDGLGVFDLVWQGTDSNVRNEREEPALVWALKSQSLNAAKSLALAPDVDFNLTNANGEDALMLASLRNQAELVKMMLERGARFNKMGWTALHYAATAGSVEILQILLQAGANVNALAPNHVTPLMMAARHGNDLSVRALVNAGADYLAQDSRGRNAADYAAGASKEDLAKKLRTIIRARLNRQP